MKDTRKELEASLEADLTQFEPKRDDEKDKAYADRQASERLEGEKLAFEEFALKMGKENWTKAGEFEQKEGESQNDYQQRLIDS